jgi:hypothetical protein
MRVVGWPVVCILPEVDLLQVGLLQVGLLRGVDHAPMDCAVT